MLCDINSTFGSSLNIGSTGIKGDVIDMGASYNVGAGANRPPYLVITTDTAVTGSGMLSLYASASATSTSGATKIMSIPVAATAAEEILFAGILPAIPEAAGKYLILSADTAATSGTVTAQIVNNPPVMRAYPAK